ncbi:MAG: hypothetical protein GC185_09265 [Alphaproteobacteria bacterium]|nr:hypothetical protein [Alphaproteobacteria bacterium]
MIVTGVAAGMMAAGVSYAASSPPQKAPAATAASVPSRTAQQDMADNAFVLGRIGVTQIALVHGLKGEAMAGIESALDTSAGLNARNTAFNPDAPVALGRLSYKTVSGEQDFYIPMVNRVFSARVFDDKLLRSSAPDVEMKDAQIVHARVALQGPALHAALLQAKTYLRDGRQDKAMEVLSAIVSGAVTGVSDKATPVNDARDNLQLAGLLLKDKSFKAASFAVDHARQAMVAAASEDASLKDRAGDVGRLVQGLGDLNTDIRAGRLTKVKMPENAVSGLKKQLDSLSLAQR